SHLDLRGRSVGGLPDEDRTGATGEGIEDEAVPVGPFSLERDEQGSRPRLPRVGRHRGDVDVVPGALTPDGGRDARKGTWLHAPSRSEPSSSRAIDRSSNGTMVPATSWYRSCPLPAITTMSPCFASR